MSEHVGGRVMLVGERGKLLIFMNASFSYIGRARRVHRRPAVEAYRDRGKLATLTSGQNKYATPVWMELLVFVLLYKRSRVVHVM